jgi:hypothetical protein
MPTITYNRNIPNPPDSPQADVPKMKVNTNSISDIINVDHYTFGTTSPLANIDGLHKQVTMVNEAAPGLSTGNGVLYANLANGQSWPFWQNALGSFELLGQNSSANNGYITLGGMLFQWGRVLNPGASGGVTFNIDFPSNNAPFVIFLTPYSGSSNRPCSVNTSVPPDKHSFGYLINSAGAETLALYWLAIGN